VFILRIGAIFTALAPYQPVTDESPTPNQSMGWPLFTCKPKFTPVLTVAPKTLSPNDPLPTATVPERSNKPPAKYDSGYTPSSGGS
jgi:hypothetical protein